MQLTINLLVTFTAIVLGLLTTSVKAGFDSAYNARGTYAAELAQLDEDLRQYGPETGKIREQLREYVAGVIASTWPEEKPPAGVRYPDVSRMPLTGESPCPGRHRQRRRAGDRSARAEGPAAPEPAVRLRAAIFRPRQGPLGGDRGRGRSISAPFYWVLALWLVILFASLGLTAPANPVTIIVIALSAISITVAVFVIIDLDLPYGGLFGIPSTSMRNALADMTRP